MAGRVSITLWQVERRDAASFATYERCDVFHVENWSTRLDLMILAVLASPTAMVVNSGLLTGP